MRRTGLLLASVSALLALASASALATGSTGASTTTGVTTTPTGPTGTTGASGPKVKPHLVSCPAGVASLPSSAQWVWSAFGKPASSGGGVSYSQSGGNGTWSGGSAHGTICSENQGGGKPKRSIVLKVSGASKLTPGLTRGGLLGIGITLQVTVSKSGDPDGCPVGSTGKVTLFASYYSTHSDRASIAFNGACTGWNESFSGSILHVEISNNGAMIRPG
jgi:hypothetical protein